MTTSAATHQTQVVSGGLLEITSLLKEMKAEWKAEIKAEQEEKKQEKTAVSDAQATALQSRLEALHRSSGRPQRPSAHSWRRPSTFS